MTSELLSSLRYGSVCDAKAILLFEMGLNPEVYQQNCGRNLGKDLLEKFNNHWRYEKGGWQSAEFPAMLNIMQYSVNHGWNSDVYYH